jgi:uracil DNA glycosylase
LVLALRVSHGSTQFLHQEWATAQVFPPPGCIFRALNSCALCDVRVVILGQDPYHDDAQACGLSFSVPKGQRVPSSLQNVYKEARAHLQRQRQRRLTARLTLHACSWRAT